VFWWWDILYYYILILIVFLFWGGPYYDIFCNMLICIFGKRLDMLLVWVLRSDCMGRKTKILLLQAMGFSSFQLARIGYADDLTSYTVQSNRLPSRNIPSLKNDHSPAPRSAAKCVSCAPPWFLSWAQSNTLCRYSFLYHHHHLLLVNFKDYVPQPLSSH
jgi:hypothetical protein